MKISLFKKVVATVAVMSLVLASSMSVFAKDSAVAGDPNADEIKVVDSNQKLEDTNVTVGGDTSIAGVELVVGPATTTDKPSADDVRDAMNEAGYVYDANATIVTADVSLVDLATGEKLKGAVDGVLEVRVPLDGVTANDTVVVMVQHEDGKWYAIKVTSVGDGYVICEMDHFSPVAFIVTKGGAKELPKAEDKKPGATTTTTTTSKTSPKTGE